MGWWARLMKRMYGTQKAAESWQQEYSAIFVSLGFVQRVASPCLFWHKQRRLICSVHGDDFTFAGPKLHLDWFEEQFESRYEVSKGRRLGPGAADMKEGKMLNRVIKWTPRGLDYEADPRQVERLLSDLELDGPGVKPSLTPGVKTLAEQVAKEQELPE